MGESMKEYQSPFLLPGQGKHPKCNNPGDARLYPSLHADAGVSGSSIWGRECPVHSRRKASRNRDDPWLAWYKYREEYAKLDSSAEDFDYRESTAMDRMLARVTADNPPDAPFRKPVRTKTKTWHDIDGRPHRYAVPAKEWKQVAGLSAWLVLWFCVVVSVLSVLQPLW